MTDQTYFSDKGRPYTAVQIVTAHHAARACHEHMLLAHFRAQDHHENYHLDRAEQELAKLAEAMGYGLVSLVVVSDEVAEVAAE